MSGTSRIRTMIIYLGHIAETLQSRGGCMPRLRSRRREALRHVASAMLSDEDMEGVHVLLQTGEFKRMHHTDFDETMAAIDMPSAPSAEQVNGLTKKMGRCLVRSCLHSHGGARMRAATACARQGKQWN